MTLVKCIQWAIRMRTLSFKVWDTVQDSSWCFDGITQHIIRHVIPQFDLYRNMLFIVHCWVKMIDMIRKVNISLSHLCPPHMRPFLQLFAHRSSEFKMLYANITFPKSQHYWHSVVWKKVFNIYGFRKPYSLCYANNRLPIWLESNQIKLNDAIYLYISYLRQGFAASRYLASAHEVPNAGIQFWWCAMVYFAQVNISVCYRLSERSSSIPNRTQYESSPKGLQNFRHCKLNRKLSIWSLLTL